MELFESLVIILLSGIFLQLCIVNAFLYDIRKELMKEPKKERRLRSKK